MKKVLFHTGRGGRFYNAGHKTCKGIIDYFNPEYYGINIYYDEEEDNPKVRLDNGEVACSLAELNADRGSFNIDNDYDTYSWCPISELDEEEMKIIVRDLKPYEYKGLLIENGVDKRVFKLLEETLNLSENFEAIYNQLSFEDFIGLYDVVSFESEEEAEENGYKTTIEIESKFYWID